MSRHYPGLAPATPDLNKMMPDLNKMIQGQTGQQNDVVLVWSDTFWPRGAIWWRQNRLRQNRVGGGGSGHQQCHQFWVHFLALRIVVTQRSQCTWIE